MALWDIFSGRIGGGVQGNHWLYNPAGGPDTADVNQNLLAAVNYGGTHLPQGYTMKIVEGYNPSGHVPDSQHHIKGMGALDVQIYGPNGQPISNRGEDTTGMYQRLAQGAYGYLQNTDPALASRFAWGGAFGTGRGSTTRDLMHFDLGGPRGSYGGGAASWQGGAAGQGGGGGGTIRWNNPGNIRASSWTQSLPGYAGSNNGFAVFDTLEHGNAAMSALLDKYAAGGANTVSSIISKWAPSNENDTASYIQNVAKRMGVDPNAPLTAADRSKLMEAITIQEHGHTASGDAVAAVGGAGGGGDSSQTPPPPSTDLSSLFGDNAQAQEGYAGGMGGMSVGGGSTVGSEQAQGTFTPPTATPAPEDLAASYLAHDPVRRSMTTPLGQLFNVQTIGMPPSKLAAMMQAPQQSFNPYAPG